MLAYLLILRLFSSLTPGERCLVDVAVGVCVDAREFDAGDREHGVGAMEQGSRVVVVSSFGCDRGQANQRDGNVERVADRFSPFQEPGELVVGCVVAALASGDGSESPSGVEFHPGRQAAVKVEFPEVACQDVVPRGHGQVGQIAVCEGAGFVVVEFDGEGVRTFKVPARCREVVAVEGDHPENFVTVVGRGEALRCVGELDTLGGEDGGIVEFAEPIGEPRQRGDGAGTQLGRAGTAFHQRADLVAALAPAPPDVPVGMGRDRQGEGDVIVTGGD